MLGPASLRGDRRLDGETMTVEVRPGEWRVAGVLLQPVLRYAAEGLRER